MDSYRRLFLMTGGEMGEKNCAQTLVRIEKETKRDLCDNDSLVGNKRG